VSLYTKNGYDCTERFGVLSSALAAVPARSCIIDGEVTAFDPRPARLPSAPYPHRC